MCSMRKLGSQRGINVVPLYAVSQDAATTILDLTATLGVDFLIIGASQRTAIGPNCFAAALLRTSHSNYPSRFT